MRRYTTHRSASRTGRKTARVAVRSLPVGAISLLVLVLLIIVSRLSGVG